jgi:uncharacterized protein YdaU (DUF1376 family)
MRKEARWMPLDVGDYLGDTMHLNTTEHGAYFLMLMAMWRTGPLFDDDGELAAIARVTVEQWRSMAAKLKRFFCHTPDGRLTQKRCAAEMEKAGSLVVTKEKVSLKRSLAGALGAKIRWDRHQDTNDTVRNTNDTVRNTNEDAQENGKHSKPMANAMANAMARPLVSHSDAAAAQQAAPAESPAKPTETVPETYPWETVAGPDATPRKWLPSLGFLAKIANGWQMPCVQVPLPSPLPDKEKEERKTESLNALRALAGSADVDFDSWWAAYPRKKGKGRAKKAWKFALGQTDAATMTAALASQIAAGVFTIETRFVPHPGTWLAEERWTDEIEGADGFDPVLRAAGLTPKDYADGGEIIDITAGGELTRC